MFVSFYSPSTIGGSNRVLISPSQAKVGPVYVSRWIKQRSLRVVAGYNVSLCAVSEMFINFILQ